MWGNKGRGYRRCQRKWGLGEVKGNIEWEEGKVRKHDKSRSRRIEGE